MTGNGLQSSKDELLGDNGAQQAPSTLKEKEAEAEAFGTKSKKPGTEALRTQSAKTAAKTVP